MYSSESTLPLKFDPLCGESGLGYCLRVITKNGSNFHAVRRLLNLSSTIQFNRAHAEALAGVLYAPSSWLRDALSEGPGIARGARNCYGHVVFSHNHMRLGSPQVCPCCIHKSGYCKAIWDISMSTVCLEHQTVLIDSCSKCGKKLRWDRPSVDVGHCGHYIQDAKETVEIAPEILQWQLLLESLFASKGEWLVDATSDWTTLLSQMSLGGAFILIAAFGSIERPYMPVHTVHSVKTLSPTEWQAIISRAIQRIQSIELNPNSSIELSQTVAQPTLSRLLQKHADTADQQIALDLLQRIFKIRPDRRMRGQYPNMGQYRLF